MHKNSKAYKAKVAALVKARSALKRKRKAAANGLHVQGRYKSVRTPLTQRAVRQALYAATPDYDLTTSEAVDVASIILDIPGMIREAVRAKVRELGPALVKAERMPCWHNAMPPVRRATSQPDPAMRRNDLAAARRVHYLSGSGPLDAGCESAGAGSSKPDSEDRQGTAKGGVVTTQHTPGPRCEECGDTRRHIPKIIRNGKHWCENIRACRARVLRLRRDGHHAKAEGGAK